MAHIGFVSTSVLESKDGIDFNEEVRKESEEVLEAERIAKEADKKPLWEQLAGKRDEKQAKFDAVRASMFAPPRALDDEESNFLQGVEAQRLEARERKDQWEAEELRGFALARANQTVVAIAEPKKTKPKLSADEARGDRQEQEARSGAPPPVVAVKIKAKRKKNREKGKDEKRAKKKTSTSAGLASAGSVAVAGALRVSSRGEEEGGKGESAPTFAAGKGKGKESEGGSSDDGDAGDEGGGGKGLSSLLGAYGSDSDGSSDDA